MHPFRFHVKPTRQKTSAPDERKELRDALRKAVNLEQRFGIREDARPEIEAAWDDAIDLLLRLKG
jgi:hypothetical protein